jgi:hypothetical protein
VTSIPPNYKGLDLGDRVLEINGTKWTDFRTEAGANGLFESFSLCISPNYAEDTEEEDDIDSEDEPIQPVYHKEEKKMVEEHEPTEPMSSEDEPTQPVYHKEEKKMAEEHEPTEPMSMSDSSEDEEEKKPVRGRRSQGEEDAWRIGRERQAKKAADKKAAEERRKQAEYEKAIREQEAKQKLEAAVALEIKRAGRPVMEKKSSSRRDSNMGKYSQERDTFTKVSPVCVGRSD